MSNLTTVIAFCNKSWVFEAGVPVTDTRVPLVDFTCVPFTTTDTATVHVVLLFASANTVNVEFKSLVTTGAFEMFVKFTPVAVAEEAVANTFPLASVSL